MRSKTARTTFCPAPGVPGPGVAIVPAAGPSTGSCWKVPVASVKRPVPPCTAPTLEACSAPSSLMRPMIDPSSIRYCTVVRRRWVRRCRRRRRSRRRSTGTSDLRAVDVVDGVDRPVDVEVIAPLRRATTSQGDRDGVDRREDDLEMLALHPGGRGILGGTHGTGWATVMPTPAALAAAPARNAVRRLMGAFVLVGRSGDIIVLLGREARLNDEAIVPVEGFLLASPPVICPRRWQPKTSLLCAYSAPSSRREPRPGAQSCLHQGHPSRCRWESGYRPTAASSSPHLQARREPLRLPGRGAPGPSPRWLKSCSWPEV